MNQLRDVIRQVAAKYPNAQPDEITVKVVAQTSEEQVWAFYRTAVHGAVLDVLRSDRNDALLGALTTRPVRRQPNRSSKVDGIRSWWQELLGSRIRVPYGYKLYGDCTVADLDFVIKVRETHIANVQAFIDLHQRLRTLMVQLGVDRVRDLPEEVAPAPGET
jgi:hypothetical protein